jgi:hypothetical protein
MSVTIFINLQIGTLPMKRILIMEKGMWKLLIWLKKMEFPLVKKYAQPQLLVPVTTLVEEQPPPPPPLMITIEIKNNDDPFEENNEVEDDIQEDIVGEIFVGVDEKEKSCLGAIYVDFSKYLSSEELCMPCPKENSMTSFFQVGCLM